MNTFEFKGKMYKEAPERNECDGCAFDVNCDGIFGHVSAAKAAFGGGCSERRVIYIRAEDKPTPSPYAWAVTGCSQLFTGEYAEHDAKAWQKHIGGNTEAFPLYRVKENEK